MVSIITSSPILDTENAHRLANSKLTLLPKYLEIIIKQGQKRPLDTPKRMIERKKGRRRYIEREEEIRERVRGERDREVKGIERVKGSQF